MSAGNEEIRLEMARAMKSFRAARKLCNEQLYEDAISRSYYAVLHAAKAALLAVGCQVGSHGAAKRLFGEHLVKEGIIDEAYSKILREEQDDRILADYDVAFDPGLNRVEQRITDALSFLKEMERFLAEKGYEFQDTTDD